MGKTKKIHVRNHRAGAEPDRAGSDFRLSEYAQPPAAAENDPIHLRLFGAACRVTAVFLYY